MNHYIYNFRDSKLVKGDLQTILGGKGAGLSNMISLGLSVPDGFTITSDLCRYFYQYNCFPENFIIELKNSLEVLENQTGKKFGSSVENPLLLSIRSGSKFSMPGMMDTILNLGITDHIAEKFLIDKKNNFGLDCYRRFLSMYGNVVLKIPNYNFEDILLKYKSKEKVENDNQISENSLREIISHYKDILKNQLPESPFDQLIESIKSILLSWGNERAVIYRKLHNISDDLGTAVNVQSMVFGNKSDNSATGVCFTRNPSTGERILFGEYLQNAQGEDVVAGIRNPEKILSESSNSMKNLMPESYSELIRVANSLEKHYLDMQDIEFTIEDGKLYILQTRSGKRSCAASIKIAHDMVDENLISKEEAILRIDPESLTQLLYAKIDYSKNPEIIGVGLPASPGAAVGIVVFNSSEAEKLSQFHNIILVRNETSPDDIQGMYNSVGILTKRGGMTSHAAVVARGLGKPCICGANSIVINEKDGYLIVGDHKVSEGDLITIDGDNGNIILGKVALIDPELPDEFHKILSWSMELKRMSILANSETAEDTLVAMKFGAEGIGLCRTEHMFFHKEKIRIVQEMILATDNSVRQKAIDRISDLQSKDFLELFKIIENKPINIRLLDPPLHEFLPSNNDEIDELSKIMNLSSCDLKTRINNLSECNPMLGNRGSRLGIIYPAIYEMQIVAIVESYIEYTKQTNIFPQLEIMLPLISSVNELIKIKELISKKIKEIEEKHQFSLTYLIGSMIEIPRACIIADQIAEHVDYFSFGTNDLTQTVFGFSRDDCGALISKYVNEKILTHDPFVRIDEEGVGYLIDMASHKGRLTNKNIKLGICGEHAANPQSIEFFERIGLNYISCSPFRIPIAIVAAAQSSIKNKGK
jgi:pyruvate,orthophosphate dikinase